MKSGIKKIKINKRKIKIKTKGEHENCHEKNWIKSQQDQNYFTEVSL